MKSFLSVAALLVSAAIPTFGQVLAQSNQCQLKVGQSPSVRGLKLGMTLDEVLAVFPAGREDEYIRNAISDSPAFPNFDVVSFVVGPALYANKERFAGIESLYFGFVDRRMVRYEVGYRQPPWPRLDEFVDKVAAAFGLPAAPNWTTDNAAGKSLICDGFRIHVLTRDSRGRLILATDEDPTKIRQERRAAAEEKARRDFRP